MNIKKLKFSIYNTELFQDNIVFYKPLHSNLFRCPILPTYLPASVSREEIRQVLNTICIYHKNIWYIKVQDEEKELILTIFKEMGMSAILIEPHIPSLN